MDAAPRDGARRCALVVAHPGHELRLHGWLSRERPHVSVLTDGSGAADVARIGHTTRVLEAVGARRGPVYAEWTDRRAYAALMAGDPAPWQALVVLLADHVEREALTDVVCDAAEGFNPVHDLTHLLADLAARRAARRLSRPVAVWDFPLEDAPAACPPALAARARTLTLDEAAFAAKLRAIEAYGPLADEVERAFARHGRQAFATERLRPASRDRLACRDGGPPPDYELTGRERVASGRYRELLSYAEHVRPLVAALDALDALDAAGPMHAAHAAHAAAPARSAGAAARSASAAARPPRTHEASGPEPSA